MGTRRQAREATLLLLYLCDNCGYTDDEALKYLAETTTLPEEGVAFSTSLFLGARGAQAALDTLIERHAENWDLDRMAVVDRNILRLAAFELLETPGTPVNVVIDEAVELAKQFSTADSSKFVNGILDKLKDERSKAPAAT